MSVNNPWTQHRQSFWQERAGSPSLALWHRVYCLAYGVHRRNGHAPFKPGDLRTIALVVNDPSTGEVMVPSCSQVSHAIRTAIEYGFLAPESHAGCLVVPEHAIGGGVVGSPTEECKHHRPAA